MPILAGFNIDTGNLMNAPACFGATRWKFIVQSAMDRRT